MGYINATFERDAVKVWERVNGKRVTKLFQPRHEFYVKDPNGGYHSLYGDRLARFEFATNKEMKAAREQCAADHIEMFESDINPAIKVLSEHYYGKAGGEKLHVTFLDIEVDYDPKIGFSDINNPYAPINAISLYHEHTKRCLVLAVPPPNFTKDQFDKSLLKLGDINLFDNEAELLQFFINEIQDSDALVGWNSNLFDFPYIGKRVDMVLGKQWLNKLSFGDARPPSFRKQIVYEREHEVMEVGGRLLGDYMMLYKKFEQGERESYKLEMIAEAHLPDLPKLTFEGSLAELYNNNFNMFLRYNIRDTEILKGFERELGYMDLAILMFQEATGLFPNVTGTVRLADYSILNYCHHVLDVKVPDIKNNGDAKISLKGADVLDPTPGLFEWVGSVDVSSLYPSCIRSVNMSPEKLIGQFTGFVDDARKLAEGGNDKLTFRDEATGDLITEPASTWRELFITNHCTVSGYGTVFSAASEGVLPSILRSWYTARVEVNARIDSINEQMEALLVGAEEVGVTTPAPDRPDHPGFGSY
jgi:DNA polymerase elongation subunit (family B)